MLAQPSAQYPATSEFPRPLDIFGGATPAFAYGLRLLDSDYTGYAIRVRRDADDIEVEVKFDGAGNVSLASPIVDGGTEQTGSVTGGTYSGTMTLKAFAGSDTCRVVKWYDQSGNGRDAFQTVEANQPILITLGTLEVDGLHFQGGVDYLQANYKFTTTNDHTFHAVARTDSEGVFGILSNIDASYNDGAEIVTEAGKWSYRIDSTDLDVPATTTGKAYLLASYDQGLSSSDEQQIRVNGVRSQQACNETLSFDTSNRIRIGARRDTDNELDGKIEEIIAWNSFLSTGQQDLLEKNTLQFFDLPPYSTKGISLDGTNDYVDCGTAIGDALGDNYAGDLTVSMWFKADVTSGDDGMFEIGAFAGAYGDINVSVASDTLRFKLNAGNWTRSVAFTDTTNWNHVAVVYKGGSESDSKIYLNGIPTGTTSGTFPSAADMDFDGLKTIIGAYSSSTYPFDGNIDDVSLFTEALSESQIADILYNKGRPRDLSVLSPAYWWKCGDGESDGFGTHPDAYNPADYGFLTDEGATGISLGDEVLADPVFEHAGAWTIAGVGAGETFDVNTSNAGKLTAVAAQDVDATQTGVMTDGQLYLLEITTDTYTQGAYRGIGHVGTWHVHDIGVGTFKHYFRASGADFQLRVDGVATLTATDISLKPVIGAAGLMINGADFSTDVPPDRAKFSSRSIEFDGTNDWMPTGADATLATKSYSFWAKSDETGSNLVFSHGNDSGWGIGGTFIFNQSSSEPLLYMEAGTHRYWADNSSQDDNAWHHHCVVIDSSAISGCKWYVDGVLQTAGTTTGTDTMDAYVNGLRIGRGGTNYFDGSLSDFSVHDGVLTAAQVADIYNGGNPKNIDYLAPDHWWRMGEGSDSGGTQILDVGALQTEPPELVTNGDFADASVPDTWNGSSAVNLAGWTSGGATFTADAHFVITDGACRLISDGTNTVINSGTTVVGLTYEYSIDVTNVTSGGLTPIGGGVTLEANITAPGTYTGQFTAVSATAMSINRQSGTTDITFDNVSVKQVLKGSPGVLTNGPLFKSDAPYE